MNTAEYSGSRGATKRIRFATFVIGSMLLVAWVASVSAAGMMQISGEAILDGTGAECVFNPENAPEGWTPDYAFPLRGDLEGCLFVKVDSWACSPSGTYRERGTEFYDIQGGGLGKTGTFMTNYLATVKWESCPPGPETVEIFGRCQHPIINGSGTGEFAGVKGRLDFKDFPEINYFPFRGHMMWVD